MNKDIENDPYWNLMGAIEDMKETGVADEITIRTCERVLLQIKQLQADLETHPEYFAKKLLTKNPFRE